MTIAQAAPDDSVEAQFDGVQEKAFEVGHYQYETAVTQLQTPRQAIEQAWQKAQKSGVYC